MLRRIATRRPSSSTTLEPEAAGLGDPARQPADELPHRGVGEVVRMARSPPQACPGGMQGEEVVENGVESVDARVLRVDEAQVVASGRVVRAANALLHIAAQPGADLLPASTQVHDQDITLTLGGRADHRLRTGDRLMPPAHAGSPGANLDPAPPAATPQLLHHEGECGNGAVGSDQGLRQLEHLSVTAASRTHQLQ